MATTKIWAVKNNPGRVLDYANDPSKTGGDLATVLKYAKNGDKTEHEYYTGGLNCDPDSALSDFYRVKNRFRKTGGVLAYHGYISFAPGECTPDEALDIGMEFARKQWGKDFQVVVTEHLNTDCLHCHFVINSVAFTDGHKLQDDEKNWKSFKHLADDICKAHGKSVIETEGRPEKRPTKREIQIKNLLDKGIAATDSPEELKKYLEKRGCICDFEHKHWTVTPKGWTKPYRIEKLASKFERSPDYSKEGLLKQFAEPALKVLPKPEKKSNRTFKTRYDLMLRAANPYYELMMILLMLMHKRWLRYIVPVERYKFESKAATKVDYAAVKEIEQFKHDYSFMRKHNLKTEEDAEALKASLKKEKTELEDSLSLVETRINYEGLTDELKLEEQRLSSRIDDITDGLKTIKRLQAKAPESDADPKSADDKSQDRERGT